MVTRSMATRIQHSGPWAAIQGRTVILKRLLLVCVLMALDLRDLYYKVVWQGPDESFSFLTGSTEYFQNKPLVSSVTDAMRANGSVASGWSSFLSRCDELYPSTGEGSTFFLATRATNCRLPMANGSVHHVGDLVIVGTARVDSIAWAACNLLHYGRRPAVCADSMVGQFNKFYGFSDVRVDAAMMAAPGSEAEEELLQMLDLIGLSYPIHHIVCVGGFQLKENQRGRFAPHLFGCASPNLYRAEFVGIHAKGIEVLQGTKAWLTNDVLAFLGWRYAIRQNAFSEYVIDDAVLSDGTKAVSIETITATNFSSHGVLYGLVVVIDVILLLTHLRNFASLIRWMRLARYYELQLWIEELNDPKSDKLSPAPVFPGREAIGDVDLVSKAKARAFDETELYAIFTRSFYRTPSYRVLLLGSRLLSWLIIMPNSVIWTWSSSTSMKLMAYLGSIKSWVLVAKSFMSVWEAAVKLHEPLAYHISRRTHITNQEIIVISSLAALAQAEYIFAICETKWHDENQRVNDLTSFPGFLAHGNTFQPALHHQPTSPLPIAWIIYWPLVRIIVVGIAMIIGWLGVKAVGYMILNRVRGRRLPPVKTYARQRLETSLDCPIRALSIIRSSLCMEIVKDGQLYVRPSCYLDYGIMLKTVPYRRMPHTKDIFKRHVAPSHFTAQAAVGSQDGGRTVAD